jgi:hypothetical protein
MTVAELVAKLQELPQDAEVSLMSGYGFWGDEVDITTDSDRKTVRIDSHYIGSET